MPEKQTRKLAVVMFTNIVDYMIIVQQDEAATLAKVDIHRIALQKNTEEFNGQIISFYGDGSLSTYPSAIDAIKGALRMQEVYREHDVPVRIGMHLGDIVYKGDSVYGDGVNVASRVESQGKAGSILLSAKLQQEISNHPEIQTKSLGFYKLKNVKKLTELYAITNPGLVVPVGRKRASIIKKILARGGMAIVLALLIGYVLYDQLYVPSKEAGLELREQNVAVRFQDFARIADRLEIPAMASHWISNRLRAIPGTHVVNYDDALAEPELLLASAGVDKRLEFAKRTNAITVLEGTIYRQGDRLLFEAHIYNLETGDSQKDFELVECDVSDPMQGISDLGNKILGWWATKDDLVYSVPNYKAYQLYLEARNVWKEDEKMAEAKLKESISADTTFIDPYFLITELYSNNSDYIQRDSLLTLIKSRFKKLTPRQRSLMDVYEAQARGDLMQTYLNYQAELASDPLDVFVNTAGMVQALQYVNRSREAITWFNMIPVETLDMNECAYCQTRLRLATVAYIKLGKIDSAIYTSSILPTDSERNMRSKLKAVVALEDTATINSMIAEFNSSPAVESAPGLYVDMAWRFKLQGRQDLVAYYANTALGQLVNPNRTSAISVESNYLLGNYEKVIELLENVWPLSKFPENAYVLNWTSRAYARAGTDDDRLRVTQLIQNIDSSDSHGYGHGAYLQAVMSTIAGDRVKAMSLLEKAYERGYQFTEFRYQNDVDLMPLFDSQEFMRLTNPLKE
jgi:class 3 adenylate cyclase